MSPLFLLVPILLPLLGASVLLLLRPMPDKTLHLVTEGLVLATSVLVWVALGFVSRRGVTVYSFSEAFTISFRCDGLGMLFAGAVSLMWPLAMLYAFEYMKGDRRQRSFFSCYVMTYGITLGLAFSADLLTMYVFFELLTLVTIPLVSHYGNHEGMFAGRQYAVFLIGGASLAFIAVILATVDGGTGSFAYGGNLGGVFSKGLMSAVYLFGFFGFGVKAAVFPFYHWLPTASTAPTPVTALLHAVAVVNSGVFAVTRLTHYVYGAAFLRGTAVQTICLVTVSFTLVYAAYLAVRERHLKRRLAYSTVSNLSYMLFGILLLTPGGLAAGLAHMVFHSVMKMTLFLCAGAFMHVTGKAYLYELNGIGRRMPVTFAFYTVAALSLTGIPPLCGFVSKWLLLVAGAEEGSPAAIFGTACLILSAFLCAIYALSVTVRVFFLPAEEPEAVAVFLKKGPAKREKRFEGGVRMLLPIGLFTAANVVLGIAPQGILSLLDRIAQGLF